MSELEGLKEETDRLKQSVKSKDSNINEAQMLIEKLRKSIDDDVCTIFLTNIMLM